MLYLILNGLFGALLWEIEGDHPDFGISENRSSGVNITSLGKEMANHMLE